MQVTIYHNPRCGKSRETLRLIRAASIEPDIVLYLSNPPSAARLQSLAAGMGKTALEITRTKEPLFRDLGFSKKDERAEADWFKILAEHPKLIERPIVVAGDRVTLGRPPENVLDIL